MLILYFFFLSSYWKNKILAVQRQPLKVALETPDLGLAPARVCALPWFSHLYNEQQCSASSERSHMKPSASGWPAHPHGCPTLVGHWVQGPGVVRLVLSAPLLPRARQSSTEALPLPPPTPPLPPGHLPSQRVACRLFPLPREPGQQVGVEAWLGMWKGPARARRRHLRAGNNLQRNLQNSLNPAGQGL